MKRICIVTARDDTVKAFLLDQLRELSKRYRLHVVANTDDATLLANNGIRGTLVRIAIKRDISPLADLAALVLLYRLFRRESFDAVHSVTPKAGLLAMVGAALAGVPLRTHTFTGQVWKTRTGMMRALLKAVDRLLAHSATSLLADSASQREFLVAEGIVAPERVAVLGSGSISGVDVARFRPDPAVRLVVRSELALPVEAVVFLYVGRLNREKGLLELASAFATVAERDRSVRLVIVGPDEQGMTDVMRQRLGAAGERVTFVGYTRQPERFMAAADVFCLPSHREGFGTVIIEAAAAGLPSVASRIYGITDAVVEGETGLLHEPRNVEQLAAALRSLASNGELCRRLGERARARAVRDFAMTRLTAELLGYYEAGLASARRVA